MKRGGGIHTVPNKGGAGWRNVLDGQPVTSFRTKRLAVLVGRDVARALKVEHTIHRKDGVISAKNSYGKDSYPPRDAD